MEQCSDEGVVIQDVVLKLVSRVGKNPLPLSPFLFHLYEKYGCQKKDEEEELGVAKCLLENGEDSSFLPGGSEAETEADLVSNN